MYNISKGNKCIIEQSISMAPDEIQLNVNADMKRFFFDFTENISSDRLKKIAAMPRFYQTKQRQRAGKMLTETRDILTHLFAPFNLELADILGDEKFLWKQKKASIAKFK